MQVGAFVENRTVLLLHAFTLDMNLGVISLSINEPVHIATMYKLLRLPYWVIG